MNEFVAVPVLQPGVCNICHGWSAFEAGPCTSCAEQLVALGLEPSTNGVIRRIGDVNGGRAALLPLTIKTQDSKNYALFSRYKNAHSPDELSTSQDQFRNLLEDTSQHVGCLAKFLKIESGDFDVYTSVPTSRDRSEEHPLQLIVRSVFGSARYKSLLIRNVSDDKSVSNRWQISKDRKLPSNVLVFDDTLTRGTSLLSAARLLLDLGCSRVGLVAIGRHVSNVPGYFSPGNEYEKFANSLVWNTDRCCLCSESEGLIAVPSLLSRYTSHQKPNGLVQTDPSTPRKPVALKVLELNAVFEHAQFGKGIIVWMGDALIGVDFIDIGFKVIDR